MALKLFICLALIVIHGINAEIKLNTSDDERFVNKGYIFPIVRMAIYYYSDDNKFG